MNLILVPLVPLLIAAAPADVTFQDGSVVLMDVRTVALEIQTKYGKLTVPMKDVRRVDMAKGECVTAEGPISGKLITSKLKVHSPYFGELELSTAVMTKLRMRAHFKEVEQVLVPDAPWADTGIALVAGDQVKITALGMIDLWPQGPGQFMTGPKGYSQAGRGSQFPAGTLVAKTDSREWVVGDSWEGTIEQTGSLKLWIVPGPWDCPSQGNYAVKVRGR